MRGDFIERDALNGNIHATVNEGVPGVARACQAVPFVGVVHEDGIRLTAQLSNFVSEARVQAVGVGIVHVLCRVRRGRGGGFH